MMCLASGNCMWVQASAVDGTAARQLHRQRVHVLAHRNRKATKDDISKAFRRELMMYHPDHNQNTGLDPAAASERTRLIVEAYRTLKNPAKRRTYDATYH